MTAPSLSLTAISMTFFQMTAMNLYLLDDQGAVILAHIHDQLPASIRAEQQNDFEFLCEEVHRDRIRSCAFTNAWGMHYLARWIQTEDGDTAVLLLGPFLIQAPDLQMIMKAQQRKHLDLEAFYRGLKLISSSTLHSIVNILELAGSIRQAAVRMVDRRPTAPSAADKAHAKRIVDQADEEHIELIDLRYQVEKEMLHAIAAGDIIKYKKISSKTKNLYDFSERFPGQPIRTMKNALIVLNTLLRISAEQGRVQPFFLHQISEKFAKQIERSETMAALSLLSEAMGEDYCELVRTRANSGYSPIVQKAAAYISIHLSSALQLQQLAQLCQVHPAHLSRQFKKETGMTLTDFQQKQRLEEAKYLLKTTADPIGWIASYVGFDDAGYFTRVFQKLEGVTPSDYRKIQIKPSVSIDHAFSDME
ncbi:AraC family transcriptional regulator [Paenibacillus aestuarii]|uniref:Helix-turn-helix transcriptional regulator n=1 Tax=Paenibacillus aestuarii TaxID=516965 RepID=A0ABW0K6I0_9BACL|nr:response regulator transcription factor [Paenibacillus aestuarii]